jgi:prepilin-type N-terminal cleavage/methylation domain-containing protein
VKQRSKSVLERRSSGQHGFSLLELTIVSAIMLIIMAIALFNLPSMMQSTRSDTALREVMDQIRQAREFAIANRRYVQIAFTMVGAQAQVQTTQLNTKTSGGGTTNPVISTVLIQSPLQFTLFTGVGAPPDTPDLFGNSSAIVFGGTSGGPAGGIVFQSDGELVNGGTIPAVGSNGSGTAMSGSVFLGVPGQNLTARAVTVMGTTGRVHGWKWNGTAWVQF